MRLWRNRRRRRLELVRRSGPAAHRRAEAETPAAAGTGPSRREGGFHKAFRQGEDWIAPAEALPEPESGADILSRELERESRRYDRGIS